MSKLISWLVGIFLFVLVYAAALWSRAQPIETDITRRTEAALQQQGYAWAKVVVDGRDVTLKNAAEFPDDKKAIQALDMTEDIRGVRVVRDLIERKQLSIEEDGEVEKIEKEPTKEPAKEPDTQAITETVKATPQAMPKAEAEPALPKVIDKPVLEIATKSEPVAKPVVEAVVIAKAKPQKNVAAQDASDAASNTPLSPKECQQLFDRTLKDKSVQFSTGSSAIRKSSHGLLNKIANTAARCKSQRVEVAGHTDNTGTRDANIRLSHLRAESVVTYLIKRGIDPNRLIANGYGSSNPVWSNATDDGRARNRRIEFKIRK